MLNYCELLKNLLICQPFVSRIIIVIFVFFYFALCAPNTVEKGNIKCGRVQKALVENIDFLKPMIVPCAAVNN